MTFEADNFLLVASVLLIVSIVISKTGSRVGIPTLLLFIVVGMFAGSEGIGGIYFDDPKLTQFIGVVALNFILFSGGLETQWTGIMAGSCIVDCWGAANSFFYRLICFLDIRL